MQIKAGEIVAIAGVEGNGQQEIANAITGLEKVHDGEVILKKKKITNASIQDRYKKYKISHIPEDRHKHGLVLDMNVLENMVLQDISSKQFSKFGIINKAAVQAYGQSIIINLIEMEREHDLIVIFQPTRGLDVGSIEFIHNEILKLKEQGTAILLISYELSEVMALADRILVVSSGKLVGEMPVGYKFKVVGTQPDAAKYSGMRNNAYFISTTAVQGLFIGLGAMFFYMQREGGVILMGTDTIPTLGFDVIAVALVAFNNVLELKIAKKNVDKFESVSEKHNKLIQYKNSHSNGQSKDKLDLLKQEYKEAKQAKIDLINGQIKTLKNENKLA
ncbi:hypothetical protein FQA39_LY13016 [Lamprigera yunnana]|nr:hypothetical protein FQA39_LY13016 [Lamprigera yunnana]